MNGHRLTVAVVDGHEVAAVTTCSCGRSLYAADGSEQIWTAGELGYPTVRAMNLEHDPLHQRLAMALGLRSSPTLLRQVHDDATFAGDELVALEEAMVLAAQRFLNACRQRGRSEVATPDARECDPATPRRSGRRRTEGTP